LLCENRQTEGRIGEDGLARVAVIAVPANTVLISWPGDKTPAPLWGGVVMKTGEMMSLGPGNRVHARTGGPSRWHAIRVPKNDLLCYGRALCGAGFIVPPGLALWRPSPATARSCSSALARRRQSRVICVKRDQNAPASVTRRPVKPSSRKAASKFSASPNIEVTLPGISFTSLVGSRDSLS